MVPWLRPALDLDNHAGGDWGKFVILGEEEGDIFLHSMEFDTGAFSACDG